MDKNGVPVGRPEHPRKSGRIFDPNKNDLMILSVCVKLKDIDEQGRNFCWPTPRGCPRCGSSRIWGHGFVLAYFDGCAFGVWLRRYRCPDCNCIIRMKPEGYFHRFQVPISTICDYLKQRLSSGRWNAQLSTSRQRHWLAALKRKTMAYFGIGTDLLTAFTELINMDRIPVSRSI